MPSSMTFEEHGEALGDACSVLRNNALAAGLAAPVPTCPDWTVLDLVVHQGLVHRWATEVVRGLPRGRWRADADVDAEGRAAPDVLDWFDDGMVDLLNALARAPEDLDVFFFLKDAPRSREAWARRQCHETSIHAVDAMAARLGRMPFARETWIRPALAVDGIDELLMGFVPRQSGKLRSDLPLTVHVQSTDADASWTMRVSAEPVSSGVGREGLGDGEEPDVVLEGTAAALYLGLWNRGDEVTESGSGDFLPRWRADQRIGW